MPAPNCTVAGIRLQFAEYYPPTGRGWVIYHHEKIGAVYGEGMRAPDHETSENQARLMALREAQAAMCRKLRERMQRQNGSSQ